MAKILARYPYVKTAGGSKPIVWIGLTANRLFVAAPASLDAGRMRTGLAPRAGRAVDFSDSQAVALQFLTRDGEAVGSEVVVVPELDPALDAPASVDAPPPWFQYQQLALGQDFLENFDLALLGTLGVAVLFARRGDDSAADASES